MGFIATLKKKCFSYFVLARFIVDENQRSFYISDNMHDGNISLKHGTQ
jgi:hypothetical protein